jgi:hypothetical protein
MGADSMRRDMQGAVECELSDSSVNKRMMGLNEVKEELLKNNSKENKGDHRSWNVWGSVRGS